MPPRLFRGRSVTSSGEGQETPAMALARFASPDRRSWSWAAGAIADPSLLPEGRAGRAEMMSKSLKEFTKILSTDLRRFSVPGLF